MRTERFDPHRVASILERLNHHLTAFLRLPRRRLEDLACAACGLMSDVLQYRTVLLRVNNGNGLDCSLKQDRQGRPLPQDERDARLMRYVSRAVLEPVVLDMAEARSAGGFPDTGIPAAGGPVLAAPIRCGDGIVLGHLVAMRPYGAHDPDVDLPLLGILASFAGTAVQDFGDRKRQTGIKARLLKEIRLSRKHCEHLRRTGDHWRIMAENVHEWEMWIAPDGAVLCSSPSCERICGRPPESFRQDPHLLERIIHGDDLPTWRQAMADGSMLHCPCAEFRIMHQDGFVRWVSQATVRIRSAEGRDLGLRLSLRDITEQKCVELHVRAAALHDPLTNLPAQSLCMDRVGQALERIRRRDDYCFALVSVGMDSFGFFAQCCGKGQEGRLQSGIAESLRRSVRRLDTVTSLKDGEFAVLLDDLAEPREAVQICRRIQAALAKPILLDGCEMNLRASLGVAICPGSADNGQTLLHNARLAMRQAEKTGRYRLKAFTPRLSERLGQRRTLARELRRAVPRGELRLAFQPIVSLRESRLAGVEALVRWWHPKRGTVEPEAFLPLAEETGLIVDIGAWVLEEACRAAASWLPCLDRAEPFTVSVNISGRQLARPDMVDHVRTVLEKTGLPPERLRLDLTEAALLFEASTAVLTMSRLRDMGVRISLDDFTAGAPSLRRLKVFPLDDLKIDLHSFGRLPGGPQAMEIFRDVVDQARSLGLNVVAEGVEEPGQGRALSALGVEFGQGFLYARPMSAEQVGRQIALLARDTIRTE